MSIARVSPLRIGVYTFLGVVALCAAVLPLGNILANKAFDAAFLDRGKRIVARFQEVEGEEELLRAMLDENKRSSCRYTLVAPDSRILFDSIVKSDAVSMFVKGISFSLHGEPYYLKLALSKRITEVMISEFRSVLLVCGGVVAFLLWLLLFGGVILLAYIRAKKVDERQSELERGVLFDQLDEGVLLVDRDLCVLQANQKAARILGVLHTHLLGSRFFKKELSPLARCCADNVRRCRESGGVVRDSYTDNNPDRSYFDLVVSPAAEGRFIVLLKDCSSHYRMMKMGKEFIANASHELRTPITIIRGFIETLDEMPTVTEGILEEIIEKVLRNCSRMESLIKNLLILADLDYLPKNQLQECDLSSLVENCRHTLHAMHPEAEVRVEQNQPDVMMRCDADLLELALMNLLQNAVKYSPKKAEITVKVEEIIGEVRISVADRGCGIPERDLPHIFDRFYTVDKAHSRKLGGAGLGLSIVKMIVERHEGQIRAVSKGGTEFIASLPKS